MPDRNPVRVAVRFPARTPAAWRARCLAGLTAAGAGEITPLSVETDNVDLIVDLSTEPIDSRQLILPPLGYWTFVYAEYPERIDPGLVEFVAGQRAAYVRLVRVNRLKSATVLREGAVKVVKHSLSATRRRLLEAVVDWPGQQLQDTLQSSGRHALPTIRLRHRGAAGRALLRAALPVAWLRNLLTRTLQEMTREHWAIGVIPEPVQEVCRGFDPARIRWLPPPADGILADPFGLMRPDGTLVIMAEADPGWPTREIP